MDSVKECLNDNPVIAKPRTTLLTTPRAMNEADITDHDQPGPAVYQQISLPVYSSEN